LVGGCFPGACNDKDECNAILVSVADLPWWSASADDFPRLLNTSRSHQIEEILLKSELPRHWSRFTFLDKFAAVWTAIAAAAPVINEHIAHSSNPKGPISPRVKSIQRILLELRDLLSSDRPGTPTGRFLFKSFTKKLDDDDEKEFKPPSDGSENSETGSSVRRSTSRKRRPKNAEPPVTPKRARTTVNAEDSPSKS
jgi:hypothetical protein